MKLRYSVVLFLGALSCKVKTPLAPAQPTNTFVLLPDDQGRSGSIKFTNATGSVDLNSSYAAITVARADAPPSAPFVLQKPDLDRLFAATLQTMPQAEKLFLIYFETAKNEITSESARVLVDVIHEIAARHSTDVSIVGHTESTGSPDSNYSLAMRRANTVNSILAAQGVDPVIISVESHGDADPLFKTARGVAESRNRRVEILVR